MNNNRKQTTSKPKQKNPKTVKTISIFLFHQFNFQTEDPTSATIHFNPKTCRKGKKRERQKKDRKERRGREKERLKATETERRMRKIEVRQRQMEVVEERRDRDL